MSSDTPTQEVERFRYWITDVGISPGNNNPDCKFGARLFVDNEIVCNLPWIDHTRPLRWSGLLPCDVTPTSEIAIRICRSVKEKPDYFNFPPFNVSEVEEETSESILELSQAIWVIKVKFLSPAVAEQLFPDGSEKLNAIEGVYNNCESEETVKYLFKHALQFANFVGEALSEGTAKVPFLICMKAWELLDQQTQLDHTVKGILHGLARFRDINDIVGRTSSSNLATVMGRSKESINDILTLLGDISIYIYNQLTTNDLVHVATDEGVDDGHNPETYLARLVDVQRAFYASWSPKMGSCADTNNAADNEQPNISDLNILSIPDAVTNTPETYQMLNMLRPTDPSGYDLDRACIDGTGESILDRVITWTQYRNHSESLMWISGQAGMGKTSIATSLSHRLHNVRALAGSFFCQRDDPESSDPLQLFNNLIHAIAIRCPPYAYEVANAIRMDRGLCISHLSIRYEYLIKRPLAKLSSLSVPMALVAVIDGLDQCGTYRTRKQILHKLHEMSQLVPWLKIIITARPVGDIQEYFRNNCPHEPIVHIQDYDASLDIRAYIESLLGHLAERERWPDDSINKLCTMAQGVFLWAVLAVQYIESSILPSLPRLQIILENRKSPVTDHFDKLYMGALGAAIGDDDGEVKNVFLRSIGAILSISEREPLALPDLRYLLLASGQIDAFTLEQVMQSLGPLLFVADGHPVRFYHPSFKDFITTSSRSGSFCIRLDQYEAELAACCLQVMQHNLRFNICELETSHLPNNEVPDLQYRIDSHIRPALKYACTHWIDHCIASPNQALVEMIKELLQGPQSMYWVEVLSLLGRIDEAIVGLSSLASLEVTWFNGWSQIVPWIKDTFRFLLSFYEVLSTSTPHLYVSALAFVPSQSLIAQRMRPHFPNTITLAQARSSLWHPCIKTTMHQQAVQSLSISPDGSRVVTGYSDGSLCIRDTRTGARIGNPLIGHTSSVTWVVFSPSGSLVASSSHDMTIRIWDLTREDGTAGHILTGHSASVNSVAFSPDATILASGSSDKSIWLWDIKSMRPIGSPYIGHSSSVSSVAFSPDGGKLVSGSGDRTIRIWPVDIGAQKLASNPLIITGHSDSITCITVSPDGSKVASGSLDKTLRLWNILTGEAVEYRTPQAKHPTGITCVRFSLCGRFVVSSSSDGVVQLHDVATMEVIFHPFHHASSVNTVDISPDGLYVVSGSTDMTTRIWEISALPKKMAVDPFVGHSYGVNFIVVSKDGTRVVSGSDDNTVRMWDAQTGVQIGSPFTGHSSSVLSVVISPDGDCIVSGSRDKKLKLWDTATHTAIHSYQHTSIIRSLAFSPDGALVAFGSEDGKVYLWEVAGWKMVGDALQGHSHYVLSVAFSPDGATLASSSADLTIIMWDVATRTRSGSPLVGHSGWVRSVAFSPCGTRLASGSDDYTVRIWDIKAGNMIRELKGHTNWVMASVFSPNGLHIASSSGDGTVRLWNATTGQPVNQPFTKDSHWVNSVAFSSDGNCLFSSSGGKSIRAWILDISYAVTELANDPPGAFCWPSNPYKLSSHPNNRGWVTHDQQSLVFWLPLHYQQPAQFLSPQAQGSYPKTFIDYSKFVHGAAWTNVASKSIQEFY
ncbi:unnamed protein product [Rhizoctonia solani]|uniref:Nephrocystin 3-like N-terminal domain-containing protein n=1 Tax=Rhizoctonia solani TaxID=456999 RepID=A0A8H2XW00_9AGAM|nr:unnamed protein product [Rhizoctonia solani]